MGGQKRATHRKAPLEGSSRAAGEGWLRSHRHHPATPQSALARSQLPLRGANSPPYFPLYYNVPRPLSMPYFTLCKTTKITNNFRPFCPIPNMLTKYEQFIDKPRTTV